MAWLVSAHRAVESFAEVTREQVLAYAASLGRGVWPRTQRPERGVAAVAIVGSLGLLP